jgi:hypothetical protein
MPTRIAVFSSPMKKKIIAGLILMLGFGGCATYQAPAPDAKGTASIRVEDPHLFPHRFGITKIDGADTTPGGILAVRLPPDHLSVAAGHHVFKVRYTMGTFIGWGEIEADISEGHSYTVLSKERGMKFIAWIVDDSTGNPIAGLAGSDWKSWLLGDLAK